VQALGDLFKGGIIIGQVGGTIQVGGRGQTQEKDIRALDNIRHGRRKEKVFPMYLSDTASQSGLIDIFNDPVRIPTGECLDFLLIIVIGNYFMTKLRADRRMDEPDIPCTCHNNFHDNLFF